MSQFIGRLAKMIVKKARHTALQTPVPALAVEIDRPTDRAGFLTSLQWLQGLRPAQIAILLIASDEGISLAAGRFHLKPRRLAQPRW